MALGAAPAAAIVPGPNGKIAFESGRTGDTEIFTMNPNGSAQTNLTNNPAIDVFPAWSPDGRLITWSSDRREELNLDVYVMNADGSGATQLTDSPGEDRGTSWTSDGQKIVFHSARNSSMDHTFDIFKMNADGSNETMIFSNGSAAYVCGDSTNGRIAFNSSGNPLGTNPERDFEIFTMNMNGGSVVQVTSNAVLDSGPKWSPDCTKISYNSLDSGDSLDVHRINANGTGDVNLTNAPGIFDAFSAWSPDGTRVAFSSNRDVNFEIYTMSSVDGSGVARLTFTGLGEADLRSDWGVPTPPRAPCDTRLSPAGCWRFGEASGPTALDSSGNGNHGTYLNGVTLGVPGVIPGNTAARFDGNDDLVRVPDSATLDVGDSFSAEGWIKRSSTAQSHVLMNKGANGLHLLVMGAGAGSQVFLRKTNVSTIARSSVGIPADGRYHHVVATKDGANSAKIYVDGVDVTVPVSPGQIVQNTAFPLIFGGPASTPADYDEFALYDRALAFIEVAARYAVGPP